jgi:acetolactate synthase-1/3 small subunit
MTVPGDDRVLEQITKQLNKLVDVIKVSDLTQKRYLSRELMLVEVNCPAAKRAEVLALADLFDARVVSVQPKSLTVQIADTEERLDDFIEAVKSVGILDISRSGAIAVARGGD